MTRTMPTKFMFKQKMYKKKTKSQPKQHKLCLMYIEDFHLLSSGAYLIILFCLYTLWTKVLGHFLFDYFGKMATQGWTGTKKTFGVL